MQITIDLFFYNRDSNFRKMTAALHGIGVVLVSMMPIAVLLILLPLASSRS